ncbi:hypothetical protein ACGFWI_34465 [Streptomyces sp. NPDC048434]|uniref:hypothetical protein n=1 Tax=Streptomyces sp. NPDC048434 TaxID=3365549 RepID=UPI00371849F0
MEPDGHTLTARTGWSTVRTAIWAVALAYDLAGTSRKGWTDTTVVAAFVVAAPAFPLI